MPAWCSNGPSTALPSRSQSSLTMSAGRPCICSAIWSGGVTGEVHFVDAGFNVVGIPPTADLKGWTPPENGQGRWECRSLRIFRTLAFPRWPPFHDQAPSPAGRGPGSPVPTSTARISCRRSATPPSAKPRILATGRRLACHPACDRGAGRTNPAKVLVGNWRCRQIKMGRHIAYMVYRTGSRCRIRSRTWTGSGVGKDQRQRSCLSGFLSGERGAWVYLGASTCRASAGTPIPAARRRWAAHT